MILLQRLFEGPIWQAPQRAKLRRRSTSRKRTELEGPSAPPLCSVQRDPGTVAASSGGVREILDENQSKQHENVNNSANENDTRSTSVLYPSASPEPSLDSVSRRGSTGSGSIPDAVLPDIDAREQFKNLNLEVLCRIASDLRDGEPCLASKRTVDSGTFNNIIFLSFDDATKWVARIPLNGRLADELGHHLIKDSLESMVATMQYVSEHTTIPVPQIHGWDSTTANELGAPYVFMDAVDGLTVYDLTHSNIATGLSNEQLYRFVKNWAEINAELATLQFDRIGSLHQKGGEYIINKLFTKMNIVQTQDVKDDIYRGPFNSVADYLLASSTLKIHSEILSKDPAIRSYNAYLEAKLLESLLPYYVDPNLLNGPFVLSHVDLDIQHILVDVDNGCEITGVLNWDLAAVVPLQSHVRVPDILTCDLWTQARRNKKRITPWQYRFAKTFREEYKQCFVDFLRAKQLDYPAESLLEGGDMFAAYELAMSVTNEITRDAFKELWKNVYGDGINANDILKEMERADWGMAIADRLEIPQHDDEAPATGKTDGEGQKSLPSLSADGVPKDVKVKLSQRMANKLRWGWWHARRCMLCQMGTGKSSMISRYIARFSPPTSKGTERVKTAEEEKRVTTAQL